LGPPLASRARARLGVARRAVPILAKIFFLAFGATAVGSARVLRYTSFDGSLKSG